MNTTDDCSLALLIEEDFYFRGYKNMSVDEKAAVLGCDKGKLSKIQLYYFDKILEVLMHSSTLYQLKKDMVGKKKTISRYIEVLFEIQKEVNMNNLF